MYKTDLLVLLNDSVYCISMFCNRWSFVLARFVKKKLLHMIKEYAVITVTERFITHAMHSMMQTIKNKNKKPILVLHILYWRNASFLSHGKYKKVLSKPCPSNTDLKLNLCSKKLFISSFVKSYFKWMQSTFAIMLMKLH